MKKLLLFSLLIVFQSFFGQAQFEPMSDYSFGASYPVKIYGPGTVYYTTDGTDPTDNSAFGLNEVNLNITKDVLLKARLKYSDGTISEVTSKMYYYGPLPEKKFYFKPPSSWTNVCSFMNFIVPAVTLDFYPPGNKMTAVCEGWYKATYAFYKGVVYFNNCSMFSFNYEGVDIITEDNIFYDFSLGPISNPPACLLAVNDPSKKVAVVKIFPNPVQDFVNIESDKNFIAYEIIDESGKLILNKDFKGSKIDISNLKTGVYFIKLKSLSNETNIVKFIKK